MSSGICYKQPEPAPPTASCYICLENSTDSNNQLLLRNCACRGDAGWAHVACLAEFAASKVTEAQQTQDPSVTFQSFWEKCILCKTQHMQYMGLAMSEAFVKQYKHLPDTNELRFHSLYSLAASRCTVGDTDGAIELYNRLLKICDVLTRSGVDVRVRKGNVLNLVGGVFLAKQKFKHALSTFEQQRELWVAVFGPDSPEVRKQKEILVELKGIIGMGGRGHQKGDTAAELVRARQKFKECREKTTHPMDRLGSFIDLIAALDEDERYQEAMEQFEKLVAESRQTLGPNHPDTQIYENKASKHRQKMLQFGIPMASNSSAAGTATSQKKDAWAVIDCEQQPAITGQRVKVLRATKDARKYICLIKNDKGVSTKFKVTQNQLILEMGTKVEVHGLVSSTDLNGSIGIIRSFDKEKRRYAVSVRKKKTPVSIKPINLNVVFT